MCLIFFLCLFEGLCVISHSVLCTSFTEQYHWLCNVYMYKLYWHRHQCSLAPISWREMERNNKNCPCTKQCGPCSRILQPMTKQPVPKGWPLDIKLTMLCHCRQWTSGNSQVLPQQAQIAWSPTLWAWRVGNCRKNNLPLNLTILSSKERLHAGWHHFS